MKNKQKQPSKFAVWWRWPLLVLVLSFSVSLCFGIVSQVALSSAGIIVSVVVILVFISISILTDMIGVAVTAASLEPFRAMAARKVRGAKEAIKLVQNAEKVASIIADVMGDVCGILSGAAGTTITVVIIVNYLGTFVEILLASLVSACIASLTIFGKAFFKKYALKHSEKIILILGKFLSLFHSQKTKQKKDKKKNDEKGFKNGEKTLKNDEKALKKGKVEKMLTFLKLCHIITSNIA